MALRAKFSRAPPQIPFRTSSPAPDTPLEIPTGMLCRNAFLTVLVRSVTGYPMNTLLDAELYHIHEALCPEVRGPRSAPKGKLALTNVAPGHRPGHPLPPPSPTLCVSTMREPQTIARSTLKICAGRSLYWIRPNVRILTPLYLCIAY